MTVFLHAPIRILKSSICVLWYVSVLPNTDVNKCLILFYYCTTKRLPGPKFHETATQPAPLSLVKLTDCEYQHSTYSIEVEGQLAFK